MENNKLKLMENGEEVVYDILLNIEDVNGKNYVVYTKNEIDENKDIITYVAEYKLNEETGNIKLISIKDDKEWEFVKDIINSIDNEE